MNKPDYLNALNKSYQDSLPWLSTPSIYNVISTHIDPELNKLSSERFFLPDESRWSADKQVSYIKGAWDGNAMRSWHSKEEKSDAADIINDIALIAIDNKKAMVKLYKKLLDSDIINLIDLVISYFNKIEISSHPHLYNFLRFLAVASPDRAPVKLAISILGLIGQSQDVELITTLGLHEEFTLYSAIALVNMLEEPDQAIWDLSKKTEQWGRIHTINLLAQTENPEIKHWLLYEAHQGLFMVGKVALVCVQTGDLRAALFQNDVDEQLFRAAESLLHALIRGGMNAEIYHYEYAADCILRFLDLLANQKNSTKDILFLSDLHEFLHDEDWELDEMEDVGWTLAKHQDAINKTGKILSNPLWQTIVNEHLKSVNLKTFSQGIKAARLIGVDTWDLCLKRLMNNQLDTVSWEFILEEADKNNIDAIIDLADQLLPLDEIASGPANEIGSGEAFKAHNCLDFILQTLEAFPGKGWHLIEIGLRNPVNRVRNMALRTLRYWGKTNWPDEVLTALQAAVLIEPDMETKKTIQEFINHY